jgi:hypothetical protein
VLRNLGPRGAARTLVWYCELALFIALGTEKWKQWLELGGFGCKRVSIAVFQENDSLVCMEIFHAISSRKGKH